MPFSIIVAFSKHTRGIGFKQQIPWSLPTDAAHFKKITMTVKNPEKRNAVIMGRKTYDSLPEKVRPLPWRLNVVITRSVPPLENPNVVFMPSLQEALSFVQEMKTIENAFVIGGESIYREALARPDCEKIYATVIEKTAYNFDTFFPHIPDSFVCKSSSNVYSENQYEFRFLEYQRK
jgi:dihydrofolate reductase